MEIRTALTALVDRTRLDTAQLLQLLRPGQVLQATVLQAPRPGVVELQIGLTALLARTRVQLQPGMQLQLAVSRLNPQPELRLLTAPQAVRPREQLLLTALPRQQSLTDTFNALTRTLQSDGKRLPPPIRDAVVRLVERAMSPPALDSAGVREQFRGSGLFLEALLARGEAPANDLKLDLLRLLRLLQPAAADTVQLRAAAAGAETGAAEDTATAPLAQLLRFVGAALARVETQQAGALPPEPGARQTWQFDLPFPFAQQHESIMVRVERDGTGTSTRPAAEHPWAVTLRFDFATTGPIQARIVLCGEQVSSTFWCERPETDRRLGTGLPYLEEALHRTGLQVGRLSSVLGQPPEPLELPKPASGLLDVHA